DWSTDAIAHAPLKREALDEVQAIGLKLEDTLAACLRHETNATHRPATSQDLLHQGDRAGIAMPIAATEVGASPCNLPRVLRHALGVKDDAVDQRLGALWQGGRTGLDHVRDAVVMFR